MNAPRKRTALRSAAVGATATLLDLAVLGTMVHLAGVSPRIASPIGLMVGVVAQFFGHKVFAFRDRSTRWGTQIVAFLSVEVVAFGLNAIGFDVLATTTPVPPLLARLVVSSAVYFLFCLPLWTRVFSRAPEVAPARVG